MYDYRFVNLGKNIYFIFNHLLCCDCRGEFDKTRIYHLLKFDVWD